MIDVAMLIALTWCVSIAEATNYLYTIYTTCTWSNNGNAQCCGTRTTIVIDASVVNIADKAFNSCDTVTAVDFSSASGLQTIGSWAFDSMDLLASVDMSGATQLESIGEMAFYNSQQLASVKLASSITTIGARAFTSTDLNTAATVDFNGVNCETATAGATHSPFEFACPPPTAQPTITPTSSPTQSPSSPTQKPTFPPQPTNYGASTNGCAAGTSCGDGSLSAGMVVLIVLGSLGGGVLVLLLLAGFAAAIIIAVVLQKKSAPAGSEGNGSGSCSGSEGESATPPKWFVEMQSRKGAASGNPLRKSVGAGGSVEPAATAISTGNSTHV